MIEALILTATAAVVLGVPFWAGYRLGYQRGLATWQKSVRFMTPKEIAEHKAIINAMPLS